MSPRSLPISPSLSSTSPPPFLPLCLLHLHAPSLSLFLPLYLSPYFLYHLSLSLSLSFIICLYVYPIFPCLLFLSIFQPASTIMFIHSLTRLSFSSSNPFLLLYLSYSFFLIHYFLLFPSPSHINLSLHIFPHLVSFCHFITCCK